MCSFAAVVEYMDSDAGGISQYGLVFFAVQFGKMPYAVDEIPVKSFRAVAAHVRTAFSIVFYDSEKCTPKTQEPGIIQVQNGVTILESQWECTTIISINNPMCFLEFA